MEDVNWTGVWIPDGLQLVSIAPEAKAVMQHCYGGYTTNVNYPTPTAKRYGAGFQ
ncbi:hypothetical protein [Thermostichus sp. MS-CIW-39]|jgi:DMSO/TMAO reductase YedYZ molybdopterin-dependent catalytic subunit